MKVQYLSLYIMKKRADDRRYVFDFRHGRGCNKADISISHVVAAVYGENI